MLEVGEVIGERYRVERALGSGGMGTTYAATDVESGKQVALKTLSMASLQDWKTLELFEREARVLQSIDHPGVPTYIDSLSLAASGSESFCLVQELVEGESLAQRGEAGWRPDEAELKRIAGSILETLIYLHGRNPPIIHRDIKPHNVILGDGGHVALVDFGAVKDRARADGSFASTVVGTYGYMAPEQFRGQAAPSSDLYGLGATLVYLATGHDPSDLPQSRLKVDFKDACHLSARFEDWMDQILEPAPEDRIETAAEALDALRRLDETPEPTSDGPLPYLPPLEPQGRSGPRALPSGSRIKTSQDGDTFTIDLPSAGIRGINFQKVFTLAFMTFWLSFVAIWSTLALAASGLMALFSIPFWLVGFWMLWTNLQSFVGGQQIVLTRDKIAIAYKIFGVTYHTAKERIKDIEGIRNNTASSIRRGNTFATPLGRGRGLSDRFKHGHQTQTTNTVRILIGVGHEDVGGQLSETEREWLINTLKAYTTQKTAWTLPDAGGLEEEAAPHAVSAGVAAESRKN